LKKAEIICNVHDCPRAYIKVFAKTEQEEINIYVGMGFLDAFLSKNRKKKNGQLTCFRRFLSLKMPPDLDGYFF
jgi:hypothetical protein